MKVQQTLKESIALSGIGLHSGEETTIKLLPAEENKGIIFRRVDLPNQPEIPASVEYVWDTSRSTNIAIGDVKIYTIEHVLAAVRANNIDNLIIELTASEPPVGDGSSKPFVEMIEKSGVVEQKAERKKFSLKGPVYHSEGDIHLVALPADEYKISYTLDYPGSSSIDTQYHSVVVNQENFKNEIMSCRTFSLYEEVSYLIDKGLIKGGSLDNAVIITKDAVLSKEGLRFSNEMVRHKILDLIGDLSLVGLPFNAHIIAIRSGHKTNVALAKKILEKIIMENE